MIPWLLQQRVARHKGAITWSGSNREAINVIRKYELAVGDGGVLSYKAAKFTDSYCLFETAALGEAVVIASRVFRPVLDRAVQRLGIEAPSKLTFRLSAHGSETLELQDNYRMTNSFEALPSMTDWTAKLETDAETFFSPRNILRFWNRALAHFHQGRARTSLVRVNEAAQATLTLLAHCCGSHAGLDGLGAKRLDT